MYLIRFILNAQSIGKLKVVDIMNLPYVESIEDADRLYIKVHIDNGNISYNTFRADIDKLIKDRDSE